MVAVPVVGIAGFVAGCGLGDAGLVGASACGSEGWSCDCTYVKFVVAVPPAVFTVTAIRPAGCAGTFAVMLFPFAAVTLVAATPSNFTVGTPPVARWVPVIVTVDPPAVPLEPGAIPVIVGGIAVYCAV